MLKRLGKDITRSCKIEGSKIKNIHYQYGYAYGLAIAENDGKIAFLQNQFVGACTDTRGPALECAVIDKTGVLYWGKLHSNVIDLETTEAETFDEDSADTAISKQRIRPVRSENWVQWK